MEGFASASGGQGSNALIGLIVAGAILLLRNRRPRPMRLERLWVRPALVALMVASSLAATPLAFDPASLAIYLLCAAGGAAAGWQRGRFTHIEVHPETHAVSSRVSQLGVLLILAVFALKMLVRAYRPEAAALLGGHAQALGDGLVLLAGSMILAQTAETGLRAMRLLGQARAAALAVSSGTDGASLN
jgi:MYXO-CTERM domain-containing protein